MGLLEVLKDHEPIDLSKKKILQGEGVIQVKSCGIVTSKKPENEEKEWLAFKAEVINVVSSKEPNSLVAGNMFDIMIDTTADKKIKKLQNNLFTAGIPLDVSSKDALDASMAALENKLIYAYFSKGKFTPEGETEEKEFQNWKFLSAKKITPENSIPQVPF